MIAMLTSFRARALSRDWAHHVWLLERTVESMLAQTAGDVVVVIGCHDIPESDLTRNPKVHFVTAPFPVPQRDNDDMCVDKVLKLSIAARWAVENGAAYIMFNDADDLVSNRIGSLVANGGGAAGWYSTSEYFYTYGGRWMRDKKMHGMDSGPLVIARTDLLEFEVPPYRGAWAGIVREGGEERYLGFLARHGVSTCVLAAAGLQHFRTYMEARGHPLLPMPFAGNVVINHSDSTSHVSGGIGSYAHGRGAGARPRWRVMLGRARQCARWLPTMRRLTSRHRQEFSIPPDAEIPPAYLNRGSVFWR